MQALLATAEGAPGDGRTWTVGGVTLSAARVVEILAPYLTARRRARIDGVLAGRTRAVAPVVEGLVNTGNVSAVMRSAEALGFQDFHVITNEAEDAEAPRYKISERTTQGADKWLDVRTWPTPAACAAHLRSAGYRIVVTHLDENAVPIDALDFTVRTALVFGNELEGASPAMRAEADATCVIPMDGFTQSFNISVAAAVALYHARRDRLARQGAHGDLSAAEQEALRAQFYFKSVRSAPALLERAVAEEGR